ncbi:MAG TPA: hypothetical protein VL171_14080 [Verrucomicrobiae bacterium]|nr:hypothetical protein [Verrucomicrobiae bacterium]
MNEEPQHPQPSTANVTAPEPKQLSLNQAAAALGVDSFTMLSLIQRDKVHPARSPSGEITVPEVELTRLLKKGR